MRYSNDLVVFDLEATCASKDTNEIAESSVIEIGAVRLDRRTLEAKGEFSELVRPRDIPLQGFITELTGITAEMLASRDTFDGVGRRFIDWCGPRNKFILVAWGAYYDVPLLRKECRAFSLDFRASFVGGALDVRAIAVAWLAEKGHTTSGATPEGVLEKMGLPPLSAAHRALEDAKSACRILQFFHFGKALF